MKNNTKPNVLAKILVLFLSVMASVCGCTPVPAFAQSTEIVCVCREKCSQDFVNTDCEICAYDYTCCQGEEQTDESKEAVDEAEYGPLTPDGNMTLIDDYGSSETSGKQFITLTTKSGNYFYLIIDRDDKGTETVHFLNLVDESDLLELMDDDEAKEYLKSHGVTDKEEKVEETKPEPFVEPSVPETTEPEKKKNPLVGIMAIILIITASGVGGYLYFKIGKKEKKVDRSSPDPDEMDDADDEDYLADLGIDEDPILDFADGEANLLEKTGEIEEEKKEE